MPPPSRSMSADYQATPTPNSEVADLITAGVRNGSKNPKAMLKRASRSSRSTTSPPAVGSNVGRLTQTLKLPRRTGQRHSR